MKRTPGPYVIKTNPFYPNDYEVRAVDGELPENQRRIAEVNCSPNAEGNAKLIAAAPELLEACEEAVDSPHHYGCSTGSMGECDCYITVCQAAIAKAKGE